MFLGCCLYMAVREASTPKQPLCISSPALGLLYHLNQHNYHGSFASGLPGPVELFLLLLWGGRCWPCLCSGAFPPAQSCPWFFWLSLLALQHLGCDWCALGATAQSHTEPRVPVSGEDGDRRDVVILLRSLHYLELKT